MLGGRTSAEAKANEIAALLAITHQDRRVGLEGARSLRGEASVAEPFACKSREEALGPSVVGAQGCGSLGSAHWAG